MAADRGRFFRPQPEEGLFLIIDEKNPIGGLMDRLKAIVGLYYMAKQSGIPFRLIHRAGFNMSDYLVPASVQWEADYKDLSSSLLYTRRIRYKPPFKKLPELKHGLQYQCRDYWGKNLLEFIGIDDWRTLWRSLFFELFTPGRSLELNLRDKRPGHNYIAVHTRFVNSLGTFEDHPYNAPLPGEKADEVIRKTLERIDVLQQETGVGALLFSDSHFFLEQAASHGFEVAGTENIGHIKYADSMDVSMKTFTDLFLMTEAQAVYSMLHVDDSVPDCLYRSQFPRYAAVIGDKPFIRV